MVSECCFGLTKYLLFLFNLFFFFLGMLLASVGFWVTFHKTSFLSYGPIFMTIFPFSCLLGIAGTVTMLLGFFGCLGALKEVKCMLGMYFILLTILLAGEIVVGVLFFTQMTTIQYALDAHVVDQMKTYKQNKSHLEDFETTFNLIQQKNECCGWSEPSDWAIIPCSCYNSSGLLSNSPGLHNLSMDCICHVENGTSPSCKIYKVGCKDVVLTVLSDNKFFILAALLAVATVELSGMTLSMCLYKWIIVDCDLLNRYS